MSEQSVKSYEIAGKVYEQRELVLGQWRQLNRILGDIPLPEKINPRSLVQAIADHIHMVLAVILVEKGMAVVDKPIDLEPLAHHLEFSMTDDQVAEVIVDFFTEHPIASVLNTIDRVAKRVMRSLLENQETGLKQPSSSLPEVTGQNGTASSGPALRNKPSPGCATEAGKNCSAKG